MRVTVPFSYAYWNTVKANGREEISISNIRLRSRIWFKPDIKAGYYSRSVQLNSFKPKKNNREKQKQKNLYTWYIVVFFSSDVVSSG